MPSGHSERPGPDSVWTKSSFSFANGNCVEVADLPGGHVGVRDSKDAAGLVLRFTPAEWHAFVGGVRNGEFDRFGNLSLLGTGREGVQVRLARAKGPSHTGGTLRPCHALSRNVAA